MKELFNYISYKNSEILTKNYSTSFSLGILFIEKSIRKHIYAIYGLVRLADEIVDTFTDINQKEWLDKLKEDTYKAIQNGFSTNMILNSFQLTARKYNINKELIEPFFESMYMDLQKIEYNEKNYNKYIYGSAEVVGLMCLKIFVNGDDILYQNLKSYAQALGSAFQKVNFLRDIKNDVEILNRSYFPNIDLQNLTEEDKIKIVNEIESDFDKALPGIRMLPDNSRIGVTIAYEYYKTLLNKIKKSPSKNILKMRIRINNFLKILILLKVLIKQKLQLN